MADEEKKEEQAPVADEAPEAKDAAEAAEPETFTVTKEQMDKFLAAIDDMNFANEE